MNALVTAGLRIDFLHEFPYCTWKVIAFTEPVAPGCWGLGPRFPRLPLMLSLKATKLLS